MADTTTDKVLLQHPHHLDVPPVEVDNTTDALVPLMAKGYVQVHLHPMSPDKQPILSPVPETESAPALVPDLPPGEQVRRPTPPRFHSPGRE